MGLQVEIQSSEFMDRIVLVYLGDAYFSCLTFSLQYLMLFLLHSGDANGQENHTSTGLLLLMLVLLLLLLLPSWQTDAYLQQFIRYWTQPNNSEKPFSQVKYFPQDMDAAVFFRCPARFSIRK